MSPPVDEISDGCDEPEDGVGQNDPHGVLHSLNVAVALRVLLDVHLHVPSTSQLRLSMQVTGTLTLPKRPKRAIHRMNSTRFQAHTRAKRRMKGKKYNSEVMAERPPTTSAKT